MSQTDQKVQNFRDRLNRIGFDGDSNRDWFSLKLFELKYKTSRRLNVVIENFDEKKIQLSVGIEADSFLEGILSGVLYSIFGIKTPPKSFVANSNAKVFIFSNKKGESVDNFLQRFGDGIEKWSKIITAPSFEKKVAEEKKKLVEVFSK